MIALLAVLAFAARAAAQCMQTGCAVDAQCAGCGDVTIQQHPLFDSRSDVNFTCNTDVAPSRCEVDFILPPDVQALCLQPSLNELNVPNLCCSADYFFSESGFVLQRTPDQVCASKGCQQTADCSPIGMCRLSGPTTRTSNCCDVPNDCPETDPTQPAPVPGSYEDVCTRITCNANRDCLYFLDPACCLDDADCSPFGTPPCRERRCNTDTNTCELRPVANCNCQTREDCGPPFLECADLRCDSGFCVTEPQDPLLGGCCTDAETAETFCNSPDECRRVIGCDDTPIFASNGNVFPALFTCRYAPRIETGCCVSDDDCPSEQAPCLAGECDGSTGECLLSGGYVDDDSQLQPCCITQDDCEENCKDLNTCTADGVPVETCEWYSCSGGFVQGQAEPIGDSFKCQTIDISTDCVDGTSREPADLTTQPIESECQWNCPAGGQPNQLNFAFEFESAEPGSSPKSARPVYFWEIVTRITTDAPTVQNVSEVLIFVQRETPNELVPMQTLGAPLSNETDSVHFQSFEPDDVYFLYPNVTHIAALNVSFVPDARVDRYDVQVFLVPIDACQPSFQFAPECQNSEERIRYAPRLLYSESFQLDGLQCSEPCQVGPPTPPTPPPQPTPATTTAFGPTPPPPTPLPPGACEPRCLVDANELCVSQPQTGFVVRNIEGNPICVRFNADTSEGEICSENFASEEPGETCACDGDFGEPGARCACTGPSGGGNVDCTETGRCGFCRSNPGERCQLVDSGQGIVFVDENENSFCTVLDGMSETGFSRCSFEALPDGTPFGTACTCSGFLTVLDNCYCTGDLPELSDVLERCDRDFVLPAECDRLPALTVSRTFDKETCAFDCVSSPEIRGNGYTVTYTFFNDGELPQQLPERLALFNFDTYGVGTPYLYNGSAPIAFRFNTDTDDWDCTDCGEQAPSIFLGSPTLAPNTGFQFQVFFETRPDLTSSFTMREALLYSDVNCLIAYVAQDFCEFGERGACVPIEKLEDFALEPYDCEVEVCEQPEVPANTIAGTIFYDRNNDTFQDLDEPGVPGVIVDLVYNSNSSVRQSTSTDTEGRYAFTLTPTTGRASAFVYPRLRNSSVPTSLRVQRLSSPASYQANVIVPDGNNFNPQTNRGVIVQINNTFFMAQDGALGDIPPCQRDFGPFDDDDVVLNDIMIGCVAENERYQPVRTVCNDRVCRANGGVWRTYLVRHSLSNFAAFERPASSIQVTVTPGDPEGIRCLDLEELESESVNVQVLSREPMVAGRGGIGAQTHASVAYRYPPLPANTEDYAVATTAIVLCSRNASDTLNITATVYGDYCRELITRWTQCEQGIDIRECYVESLLDLSLPSDCPPPSPTPPPTPAPPPPGGLDGSRYTIDIADFCTDALCIDGGLLEIAGCSSEEQLACAQAGAQRAFEEFFATLSVTANATGLAGPVEFSLQVRRSDDVEPACGTVDSVGALVQLIITHDNTLNLTDDRLLNYGTYELANGEIGAFVRVSELYAGDAVLLRLSIPECVAGGIVTPIRYNYTATVRAPDCVDVDRCTAVDTDGIIDSFDNCVSDLCPDRDQVRPADGFDEVEDEIDAEQAQSLPLVLAVLLTLCAICVVGTLCFSGVLGNTGRASRRRRFARRRGGIRVHEPCRPPRQRRQCPAP